MITTIIMTLCRVPHDAIALLGQARRDHFLFAAQLIERPLHSLWGNGDEFAADEIAVVKQLYQKNAIRFEWAAGDVIIVDNLWWAHGRYPYHGDRKILALMGVPWARQQGSLLVAPVKQS